MSALKFSFECSIAINSHTHNLQAFVSLRCGHFYILLPISKCQYSELGHCINRIDNHRKYIFANLPYSFSLTKDIFLFSKQLQLEGLRYSSVPVVNVSMPILDVVFTRSFHLLERPLRYIKTSPRWSDIHFNDVIMGAVASQITSLGIVFSTAYSGADQRNTKALRHWPLWGEFTGDRWIPRTNGQ